MLSGINLGSRKGIGGVELGSNSLSSIPSSGDPPTVFTLVLDNLLTRWHVATQQQFKVTATAGTTGFIPLDDELTINSASAMATLMQAELEALSGYSGKVTVSGAETNAGDTYTFTITFDASLGAVTLDFDNSSQWYPTITLTEAVTQQGVATVTGVAEVVTITVGADGLSDVNFSGIGSVTFDVVAGVFNGDVPITGWTITAGGDAQTSVTYTRNSTGAIADPSLVGGDLGISVDVQGVDAVTGQPEIHTITPTPVNPTGGNWKPASDVGVIAFDAATGTIETELAGTSGGFAGATVSGTLDAGVVTVTGNGNANLSDTGLSPTNVSLTAPEITHSIA